MVIIEKIEIKHFRSFKETVKVEKIKNLNIFSGSNDAGKSNVLKALNLFFNHETIIGDNFDFEKNLSFLWKIASDKKKEKKSKELAEKNETESKLEDNNNLKTEVRQKDLFVSIKIHFFREVKEKSSTPERFWVEKVWDKNGFIKINNNIETAYKKKNNIKNLKEIDKDGRKLNAQRGQVTLFLNSISFEYVPAIKDRDFFKYLFSKLQDSIFKMDVKFRETSENISGNIKTITKDLFDEFERKTKINAEFSIPQTLIDFFNTIEVSTDNGVSLYFRGDGIQARFIPAILNEISKGKKYVIWGFEEPENSYEYKMAKDLANDFLNNYSKNKQIFITSHTKEFLSLAKGNEDKVSLYRVYKTLNEDSFIELYDKGFDKEKIKKNVLGEDRKESDLNDKEKNVLDKIFDDIGFIEMDIPLIEGLQKKLEEQRKILEKSGLDKLEQEKIIRNNIERYKECLKGKNDLEKQIEEYKKPILYVEDKYDQIYKIAYLKVRKIEFNKDNFCDKFNEKAPFIIIGNNGGAGGLSGFLRKPNLEDFYYKKIICLFDFDKEGRENFHFLERLKNEQGDELFSKENGELSTGFFKKRFDHECCYAMLPPISNELKKFASLEWENFASYVEIENLLPLDFLKNNNFVDLKKFPGGEYFKIKNNKKDKLWKKLFDLPETDFENFKPLFKKIEELFLTN